MGKRCFIINDIATWYFANKEYSFNFDDVVYTEDSYVYELLCLNGYMVRVPSQEISDKAIDGCEDLALEYANFLKNELNRPAKSGEDSVRWGNVLNLGFAYFVSTVLTRVFELEYVLSKGERIIIPYLAGDGQNRLNASLPRLTHIRCNYYALLFQFMQKKGPFVTEELVELKALPQAFADYGTERKAKQQDVSTLKQLSCRGLSLLSGDVKMWERILCRRLHLSGSMGMVGRERLCFILGDNRMINSLIIPMLLSGVRLSYLDPGRPADVGESVVTPRPGRKRLAETARDWSKARGASEVIRGAMELLVCRIEDYLEHLRRNNHFLSSKAQAQMPDGRGTVLSVSTHDHQAALFYENIRNTGLRMFCFTDGASGLNRCDRFIEQFSDKGMCYAYVTHNRYDEDFYRQLHSDPEQPIYNYCLFGHVQPRWPWLSRQLSRMLLKQRLRERLIVYAPTRFKADHRSVKGDFKDISYWQFMKKLAVSVLNELDVQVFIKTYGKEVYPGQMKRDVGEAGHPLELLNLAKHITVQSYPRLNYIIHAADVLIIDRATSTIQAALASGCPLVFVNNPSHPLDTDVINIMDRSLFLVDAHQKGWQAHLRELLSLPGAELKARWISKRRDREYFKRHYVFGENASKKRLIRWISDNSFTL